ncbi:MFS transporter [Cerasicoccus maritimus]|uniref:MFS transporter n=1 Tax=Cerasicoccus maritimus TaxID=490089 RepID=UPI002852635B|nr:MFS transporter [Cerasicoccus maritimus]
MSQHVTAAKDKVPFIEKLMYGAGSGSFQMANDGVKGLAYPIFNITLGLDPSKIGLVLMISRIVDAFTDPIMGKISDDTDTRWGRRRPYIFLGTFLVAIAFVSIWMVPESWSDTAIFVWYMCAMLIFYLCATIQTVPYHTLGLEMTPDYHERTSVSSFKMFFSFVFAFCIPWIFPLAQASVFGGTLHGMRFISWYVAIAIIIGGLLPAIFVKERYFHIAKKSKKFPFWQSIKLTFQNRPFLILTAILLTTGIGGNMVGAMGPYIIYYYIFGGDVETGSYLWAKASNAFTVGAILSLFLINWMGKSWGKLFTMRCMVVLGFVGAVSKFWLFNKDYPNLLFVSQLMMAPLAAGFWTITTSMKADICDDDELRNGSRREGMFGSVGGWITKVTMASTFFLAGMMLEVTGFDIDLGGDQDPDTIFMMRVLFATIPAISNVIAFVMLWYYPLNEKRMREIRAQLEARRGEADDTEHAV